MRQPVRPEHNLRGDSMLTSPLRIAIVGLAIIFAGLGLVTRSQVKHAGPSPLQSPSPAPSASPVQEFQVNQVVARVKAGAPSGDTTARNGTTPVGQMSAPAYYVVPAIPPAAPPVEALPLNKTASPAVAATPVPTATQTSTEGLRD